VANIRKYPQCSIPIPETYIFFKLNVFLQVLLFLNTKLKQVVGCLVAEACSAGYRMYPSIPGVDVDTCARESTPCKVGAKP